jgi:hypothetical protein
MEIWGGTYRLAGKSLKRWLGTGLPSSLQDLQQVLGRLLWASPFIPNFKERIKPIEALLSPKSPGVWTKSCTEALNELLRIIECRFTLAIANPHEPLAVDVAVSPDTGLAMIT